MKAVLALARWAGLTLVGLWLAALTLLVCNRVLTHFEPSSRVLVTAAHIGEIGGYTCIYSDSESDVGIYLKDGYKASAPPVGAEVTFLDSKGWIRETSDGEFAVEPINREKIVPGVSGTVVYYKEVPIGFISGWNGRGFVRCIFF